MDELVNQTTPKSSNNTLGVIVGPIQKKLQTGTTNTGKLEKLLKDKVVGIYEKFDNININILSISKNVKLIDQVNHKFYEDAKLIFKEIKNIHSQSLEHNKKSSKISRNYTTKSPQNSKKSKTNIISDSNKTISINNNDLLNSQEKINTTETKKPKNALVNNANSLQTIGSQGHDERNTSQDIMNNKYNDLLQKYETVNKKNHTLLKENEQLKQAHRVNNSLSNSKDNIQFKISRSISPSFKKTLNISSENLITKPAKPGQTIPNNVKLVKKTTQLDNSNSLLDDLKSTNSRRSKSKNPTPIRSKSNQNKKTDGSVSDEKLLSGDCNETLYKLTDDILDFIKQLNELQKANFEKSSSRKDLRVSFENKKQELLLFTNRIENSRKQFLISSQNSLFSNKHQPYIPKPNTASKNNLNASTASREHLQTEENASSINIPNVKLNKKEEELSKLNN